MRTALKGKLAGISEVNSIVSGVFTPPIPESVNYPLITIQCISDGSAFLLSGAAGAVTDTWQIDVYASGAGAWTIVDALAKAIKAEINGVSGETWNGKIVTSCKFDDGRDLPSNQVQGQEGLARRTQDYRIRYLTA